MAVMTAGLLAQEFEDEFRDWVADGYGSYALFALGFLILVAFVLRATRTKY